MKLHVILLATDSYPAVALYSEEVNNPSLAKLPYKYCGSLSKLMLTLSVRQSTSFLCNTKHGSSDFMGYGNPLRLLLACGHLKKASKLFSWWPLQFYFCAKSFLSVYGREIFVWNFKGCFDIGSLWNSIQKYVARHTAMWFSAISTSHSYFTPLYL